MIASVGSEGQLGRVLPVDWDDWWLPRLWCIFGEDSLGSACIPMGVAFTRLLVVRVLKFLLIVYFSMLEAYVGYPGRLCWCVWNFCDVKKQSKELDSMDVVYECSKC